jgi:hypothetical protein
MTWRKDLTDWYELHLVGQIKLMTAGQYQLPVEHLIVKMPRVFAFERHVRILNPDKIVIIQRHLMGTLNSLINNDWLSTFAIRMWHEFICARPDMAYVINPIFRVLAMFTIRGQMFKRLAEKYDAHIVQYEDLCRNPVDEFQKLYEICKLEWTDRVQEQIIAMSYPDVDEEGTHRTSVKSINRIDGWKTEMLPETIKLAKMFYEENDLDFPNVELDDL